MSYIIRKTTADTLFLKSKEWDAVENIEICNNNWNEFKSDIKTSAKLLYNDEGIYAKFTSDEHPIHINHKMNNGNVYMDSTVELFIAPDIDDINYFNFEINAEGYALIGYGAGRKRNRFADIDFSQFNIISEITDSGFELLLFVPFSFMKQYASKITKEMKGNLQKCCEVEGFTHYLSAYPIRTENPDFHAPQFFSDFCLE